MFAIAFDLVVAQVEHRHPKGVPQPYGEIRQTLERFGFSNVQGSVYVCEREDLANLFAAIDKGSTPHKRRHGSCYEANREGSDTNPQKG